MQKLSHLYVLTCCSRTPFSFDLQACKKRWFDAGALNAPTVKFTHSEFTELCS